MTRILCVFALLLAGLAHRSPAGPPPPASAQIGVDLSAFAMPDGTVPVICRSSPVTDGHGDSAVLANDCEFCRLAGAAILPPRDTVCTPPRALADGSVRTGTDPENFQVHQPGTPTRGPPLA